jgi:predicted SPOUT superfamily RNA methylase MTH1
VAPRGRRRLPARRTIEDMLSYEDTVPFLRKSSAFRARPSWWLAGLVSFEYSARAWLSTLDNLV